MLSYLKSIFGDDVSITDYDFPKGSPLYIIDEYYVQLLTWNSQQCVLLAPKSPDLQFSAMKKQFLIFQELCSSPCALSLDKINALQRKNLIENKIPFISQAQQVYLPFWGCAFTERMKAQTAVPSKMAPGTQLVFLYLYYQSEGTECNLTQISKALDLSKATCTRAIEDLTETGLLTTIPEGTNKWLCPAFPKPEFLRKALPRLKSPVNRTIYVSELPESSSYLTGGLIALSNLSMIAASKEDGAFAISKKTASKIPVESIISEFEFTILGGDVVQVWNYDPQLLSHSATQVDEISLLLSLADNPDERIQMSLDLIREKHQLPILSEE